jgi:hypothetical protein
MLFFSLNIEYSHCSSMRSLTLKSYGMVLFLILDAQSLVDIAREEAERRRIIDQQGIEAKVIEGSSDQTARNANVTTSSDSGMVSTGPPARPSASKGKSSPDGYRRSLQKLDREIRQSEERLTSKRARMQAEKWANPKGGKTSNRGQSGASQSQLQAEIEDLQIHLRQLRKERLEVYEDGKKAGFLPGELEGKGHMP